MLSVSVHWEYADERIQAAHANRSDATAAGACAFALAAIEITDGLAAISRANTTSGVDYILGRPGERLEAHDDLEHRTIVRARTGLEISGVDHGGIQAVKARVREKLLQAAHWLGRGPAIACVVGFLTRTIVAKDVEQ